MLSNESYRKYYLLCESVAARALAGLSFSVLIVPMIVQISLLLLWFYLLESTAKKLSWPALEELTDTLKMSPNVAGFAFLTFANGAPHVVLNITTFSRRNHDLAIAGLLGTRVFVTMYVDINDTLLWIFHIQCCLVVYCLLFVPRAVVGAVCLVSTPKISAGPPTFSTEFRSSRPLCCIWMVYQHSVGADVPHLLRVLHHHRHRVSVQVMYQVAVQDRML